MLLSVSINVDRNVSTHAGANLPKTRATVSSVGIARTGLSVVSRAINVYIYILTTSPLVLRRRTDIFVCIVGSKLYG